MIAPEASEGGRGGFETAMRDDEFRRIVIAARVARESGAIDSYFQIFSDLKVEVRSVASMRGADRSDRLSARHALAGRDQEGVEMSIERINRFLDPVFAIIVPNDDYVAPAEMNVPRQDDHALANAVDRIVQIAIAAAAAVPILTRMRVGTKAARFVVALRVRISDREVETVGQFGERSRCWDVAIKRDLRLNAPNEGRDEYATESSSREHGRCFYSTAAALGKLNFAKFWLLVRLA